MNQSRNFKLKNFIKDLLAITAGLLVPLSLAPFNFSLLAFISTISLIFSLSKTSTKRAFLRGYLYGCAAFGFGVHWIYISIHEHGNASPLLAGFLTMLLIFGPMALYPALKLSLYRLITKKTYDLKYNFGLLLCFPSLWVIVDWLQGWLFTGFPWLYLGYSQTSSSLAGFAPLVSVFGLTWLVVFISGLGYLTLKNILLFVNNNKQQYTLNKCLSYILLISSIFILGNSLYHVQWTMPNNKTENIVLVQGNIAQGQRWSPNSLENIINTYENLTENYWENNTIIWPESAISLPLPYSSVFINKWQKQAVENNSTLILGIPQQINTESTKPNTQPQYFNSILAIGNGSGLHNKNKLVPYGEYVPFEKLLRGIISFFDLPMSNFISGNIQPENFNTLTSKNINWLPYICYEIAYPDYVITNANQGNAIVTISNDAWFGNSIGPWQHLQLAQMRALETARPIARSTNNGITAVILPNGQIAKMIPQFKPGILEYTISGYEGLTPIMYYGVKSILALCFLITVAYCLLSLQSIRYITRKHLPSGA